MSRKQTKELEDLLYPAYWKAVEDGAAQQNIIVDDEKRISVTASFAEGS
jgi:hypothetical protein